MLQSRRIQEVAQALVLARSTHLPADAQALADALATEEEAYAVQELVARAFSGPPEGAAQFPPHWKSGGPGRQGPFTHAALPARGIWSSPADARAWPLHQRLIEVEIALRIGSAITPQQAAGFTPEMAPQLVDAMAVSIEIVDSRWQQALGAAPLLKLADLQTHGALVLGEWVRFEERDWAVQSGHVRIGAQEPFHWQGSHSMGDPARVLPAWLRHVTRQGAVIPPGAVVTTGTWCGMLQASPGDHVVAQFDGIGSAQVRL